MNRYSKIAGASLLAAFSGVGGVCVSVARAQSFEFLVGPPATPHTRIRGLSNDGMAATGGVALQTNGDGFYWTRSGGLQTFQSLGVPSGYNPEAISGNGLSVSGGNGTQAFRWSAAGGFQQLPAPSGFVWPEALATNNDGSVVGGRSQINQPFGAPPLLFATVWNAAGTPTVIDPTHSLGDTWVNAISGDGTKAVGGLYVAWSWTAAGGLQVLPSAPGTPPGPSAALGMSRNGQFIVGLSNVYGTLWNGDSAIPLFDAQNPSNYTEADFVSDDGNIVGGCVYSSAAGGRPVAGVWTPSTQFIPLADYLAANGVQVPQGVVLSELTAMSADGRTFAGLTTTGDYAWIATIPSPGMGWVGLGWVGLLTRRRR